jgi:PAS domain S-box-containing protein
MKRFAPIDWYTGLRLRTKLMGFIVALVACVSAFFLWYIPARIGESASLALRTKGTVVTAMTAANLSAPMVFDDTLQIRDELLKARLSGDLVYAVLRDSAGWFYASWGMDQAMKARFEQTPADGDLFGNEVVRLRAPVMHGREQIGLLSLGFSNADVVERVQEARVRTLIVTLLIIVASLAAIIGVTSAVTGNLQKVVLTAQRVTAGDLRSRVHVTAHDDVGELGDALNVMLDRLERYQKELGDANRDLEERVVLRTKDLAAEVEEHQKTEASLSLSEKRLRQVIDLVPHFIFAKDLTGQFVLANDAFAKAYSLTVDSLLGKYESDLVPAEASEQYGREDREVIESQTPKVIPEQFMETADGNRRIYQTVKIPFAFSGSDVPAVLGVCMDITEIKEYQDKLQASLREKEVMLKEIHHRVKNNLQVISSLLSLQSAGITDPAFSEIMLESQNRIRSMALVHERLYRSGTLATIDFSDYLAYVTTQLMRSYNPEGVECVVNAEPITLTVDDAIPCGLIVNELVSNALKHAFHDRKSGLLEVQFRAIDPKTYELVVRDDGVGFPEGVDFASLTSMGMTLVTNLTEQLEGSMVLERGNGTVFRLRFPKRG